MSLPSLHSVTYFFFQSLLSALCERLYSQPCLMGMARPLPSSPVTMPLAICLAFSFSILSRSFSSFLDEDGVKRFERRRVLRDVVGVELGVGRSLPSLSLPGGASASPAGGVLRSSVRLSADPRALLLDELRNDRKRTLAEEE